MRGMLSQIRFQAIVVALVPIAVLAAMLAYTIATRNSTGVTAFWADHTERVIEANDTLTNALAEENRTAALHHDIAGFERARRETSRRATALLAAANATPAERRQAQIYVNTVRSADRVLASGATPSQRLAAQLNIAKRDVDKSERILAMTALRAASDYLTRFSTIILFTLLGGVVLFLILAGGFGSHVWLRARHSAS